MYLYHHRFFADLPSSFFSLLISKVIGDRWCPNGSRVEPNLAEYNLKTRLLIFTIHYSNSQFVIKFTISNAHAACNIVRVRMWHWHAYCVFYGLWYIEYIVWCIRFIFLPGKNHFCVWMGDGRLRNSLESEAKAF